MEGPEFLKQKYNLHNSEEVEAAAERTEARTGESVPQKPADRIQNYLDRFNEILNRSDDEERERGLDALKQVLHDQFVIKPEEIPEGYFENQRRIAREQGHGDIEISEEMRAQLSEVVIADQESSLDKWINYLASPDATYPDWLKYYAVRSVVGMGEFDKEKKQFTKRTKGTVKPFPDLNREALAYVLDAIEKKQGGVKIVVPPNLETAEEDVQKFEKLLQNENFSKLYAWAIEKVTPSSAEQITITEGQWVKYDKDSDHMPLVESLQGHGTGWCTAGESTAEAQLKTGDFYVYYSFDQNGKPTIPRAAIRMQGGSIAEVRGIAAEQNLDPYIGDVVQEKLKEFPDGELYKKKTEDMKLLTEIENKVKKGEELSRDDLIFLYEIDTPIHGFGYEEDPRILDLMMDRNPDIDLPIIFKCHPEQIAKNSGEIDEDTKVYIGELELGIFERLPEDIEYIYHHSLQNRIRKENIEIGSKTSEQLLGELEQVGIEVISLAKEMIRNLDLSGDKNLGSITLVILDKFDLEGTDNDTPVETIYRRAEELGLKLCPPEVGLYYSLKHKGRLNYGPKPQGRFSTENLCVGMKPMSNRAGSAQSIFRLHDYHEHPTLAVHPAGQGETFNPYPFLFCVRRESV